MKSIGIFISSTFKDMDSERDMVVSVLKPAVESALKFRHVDAEVRIVDLRWGVNTQDVPEEERENKVLNDCLDYIRTSKPFFIGFIGNRYGWVPPEKRWKGIVESMTDEERAMMGEDLSEVRSVTELEMLFGVLNDSNALPSSFFFLRKPDVYQQMDPDSRSVFCDSDPGNAARLDSLRKKIRETYRASGYTGNVIDYDCQWNGSSLVIDENAITSIVNPLVRTIMSEIDIDAADCTELDDIIRTDISFAEERDSYYVPDACLVDKICTHLNSSKIPLVIKAEDGMGKTSLTAHLFNLFRDNDRWLPLVHFSSKAGYNSHCEVMLKKFLWLLPGNGFPKLPLSVEANPGLLMRFLAEVAGRQSRRVLLLIDNIQYLRDLELIFPDLAETESFSVVLTTNVGISNLRDGDNARYIGLPEQNEESSGRIAALYMDAAHKGLPAKVLNSLTGKKTDDGKAACRCPLWTIMVLNHLIGLDLNDFTRMRNIADVDDAEKITVYLQKVIDDTPASVSLLPEYLTGTLATKGESDLARAFLEDGKSGYTSLERLRNTHGGDVSFLSFQNVKKIFAPLSMNDYTADVIRFDNDILLPSEGKQLEVRPMPQSALGNYLYFKSLRLAQVLNNLPQYADDRIRDVIGAELRTSAAFFNEQGCKEISNSAASENWPELNSLFEGNCEQAFVDSLTRFRESRNFDNVLLLCLAFWNLAYRCKSLFENSSDPKLCSQIVSIMDSAFMEMNVIRDKSLSAILAGGLYFDLRSDFEKRFRANIPNAVHYKGLQEQSARILYLNSPTFSITYYYASCLDENSYYLQELGTNAAQQKRYMELGLEKNGTAIELFRMLAGNKGSDGMLLDLYMAKVRRSALLMCLDKNAAAEWNGKLLDEMQPYLDIPGFVRQYSFACDYQARCLLAGGYFEQALSSISKAVDILQKEHLKHPDDVEVHHSLATVLKYRADILAGNGSLTDGCIGDLKTVVRDILESNPNDAVALRLQMMAQVLDMYCHAAEDNPAGLYELTMQTLLSVESTLISSDNARSLELNYFIPALNYVFRNVPGEQALNIATRYTAIRTELINRRLVPSGYLPSVDQNNVS